MGRAGSKEYFPFATGTFNPKIKAAPSVAVIQNE